MLIIRSGKGIIGKLFDVKVAQLMEDLGRDWLTAMDPWVTGCATGIKISLI